MDVEEPQIKTVSYKLHMGQVSAPNPTLFKGQLYLGTETLVLVNLKKNKQTRKELILI